MMKQTTRIEATEAICDSRRFSNNLQLNEVMMCIHKELKNAKLTNILVNHGIQFDRLENLLKFSNLHLNTNYNDLNFCKTICIQMINNSKEKYLNLTN